MCAIQSAYANICTKIIMCKDKNCVAKANFMACTRSLISEFKGIGGSFEWMPVCGMEI